MIATVDARNRLLDALADHVLAVDRPHPVRVAVDGCSAAGKTTLAGELAGVLRGRTARRPPLPRRPRRARPGAGPPQRWRSWYLAVGLATVE